MCFLCCGFLFFINSERVGMAKVLHCKLECAIGSFNSIHTFKYINIKMEWFQKQ